MINDNLKIIYFFREKKNPVKKSIVMVILNTVVGVLLKSMTTYAPLNDIRAISVSLFLQSHSDSPNEKIAYLTYVNLCELNSSCRSVERISTVVFLLSLSTNLCFFFVFDKNFNQCLKRLFHIDSTTDKNKKSTKK